MSLTIVIDTNIIVSALLNPNGVSYVFLDRVFAGEYQVVVTPQIMDEYNDVLRRKKFCFSEDIIETVLEWFRNNAIFIFKTFKTIIKLIPIKISFVRFKNKIWLNFFGSCINSCSNY